MPLRETYVPLHKWSSRKSNNLLPVMPLLQKHLGLAKINKEHLKSY